MTRYKNKKSTVRADAPLVSQSTDIFRPNGFWRLQVSDDAEYRKTCAGQNLECSSIQRASESLAKKKEADECEEERRRRRRMKWEWKRGRETTGQGRPTAHARLLLLLPPHALSSSRTTKYSHDDVVYIPRESFSLLSSEIFLWKKKKKSFTAADQQFGWWGHRWVINTCQWFNGTSETNPKWDLGTGHRK